MNTTTFPATMASRSGRHTPAPIRIVARLIAAWHAATARRPFDELDEAALRDLGVSRDEQRSFLAESQRQVEATRLRVAPPNDRWMGL